MNADIAKKDIFNSFSEKKNLIFQQCVNVLNNSNAEATFVQSTRTQRSFKNHLNPVTLVVIA